MRQYTYTHTVHMALMGYFIVFSFVTKPGQTLEFLLWGTIVPLNFLAGYYCSIVASTPQPTVYAFTHTCRAVCVSMCVRSETINEICALLIDYVAERVKTIITSKGSDRHCRCCAYNNNFPAHL